MSKYHPFHLVDISPWPIFISFTLLVFGIEFVSWMQLFDINIQLILSLLTLTLISVLWWRDCIRESKRGYHTHQVQRGLLIGFILFAITEIMLFASFFWAFFNSALSVSVELGNVWPPVGIESVNAWGVPLLGTVVLLTSGFILTLGHHAFLAGNKNLTLISFFVTVVFGFLFLFIQFNEYSYSFFTISDNVFGTVFYMTTGLHALHVLVGTLFLLVGFFRIYNDDFTIEHHLGLEFAILYWHLVDVIWLLVFVIYYWWGS